ncbi:MAG: beta-N-acetylhexosaminidase [Chitinophagaceae bacterium]|nr:beta-N-acetylhexosaminidase [Chitinophagaceae bacterium]
MVFPHIYGLQEKPSLIPVPKQMKWESGFFPLFSCRSVVVKDDSLGNEAGILKKAIESFGIDVEIKKEILASEKYIELRIEKTGILPSHKESYDLKVSTDKILITANTSHGIFNGIQTLRQLMRDAVMVDACDITDWPAFSWRGYMIDVGRNYMSMKLLKQQIDVMAANKLNVFHFHATEDIAWRIAIKQYPQLTEPDYMLRNKGMYYSEAEIKELIAYCKERHIIFVPEMDMPGHSAAFRRAMKTDMQSDTGLILVKSILKEFCTTYDVPYIHIGADEVKITNKQFIPEVTSYIESFSKKVIGWQPGGNFSNSTIRQLWMDDNAHHTANSQIQFIDSRHLYLNHMDPLEAVTTIFNRKIADKENGDATILGGTICMWHDRAVSKEEDILNMNPVYAGMLAFAERSWQGGGKSGWVANISNGDEKAFAEFENRLLDNKKQYFAEMPFAYVKQSDIKWNLYGPFDNGGDVMKRFLPETESWNEESSKLYKQVTGGTIVLRHWWAPLIKGAIDDPKENTTWYAVSNIWCDEAGEKECWIGFNNLSRSPATDSPPAGAWDEKGSTIWVNGNLVPSPVWMRGGQRGNAEIPLMDEGYEYREPVKVYFQKGWNTVWVKAPVTSFKGRNWQNPVKWMFTFVLTEEE